MLLTFCWCIAGASVVAFGKAEGCRSNADGFHRRGIVDAVVHFGGLDWAGVIKWLPSTSIESELQPVLEQYLERCHKRDAYQRAVAQRKAKL